MLKRTKLIILLGSLLLLIVLGGQGYAWYSGANCGYCHTNYVTNPHNFTTSGQHFMDTHSLLADADYWDGMPVSENDVNAVCGTCHNNFNNFSQTVEHKRITELTCTNCHSQQEDDWMHSGHKTTVQETHQLECGAQCHSPMEYDQSNITDYFNENTSEYLGQGVNCFTCHNPDDIYSSVVWYYNATSGQYVNPNQLYNNNSGKMVMEGDNVDSTYGDNVTINVTSDAEAVCSQCHYNHGLGHVGGVRNSHGEKYDHQAACENCHMGTGLNHTMELEEEYMASAQYCGQCHSGEHTLEDIHSQWNKSAHNYAELNATELEEEHYSNTECAQCHSPFQFEPGEEGGEIAASDWEGVDCKSCHNIHDMGNWLVETGSPLAYYNATRWAMPWGGYRAGYEDPDSFIQNRSGKPYIELTGEKIDSQAYGDSATVYTNSTAETLCSQCHYHHGLAHIGNVTNSHAERFHPQDYPAWGAGCTYCHMGNTYNESLSNLYDHSFEINESNMASSQRCGQCHSGEHSIEGVHEEWNLSEHNNMVEVTTSSQRFFLDNDYCARCHSPKQWNPDSTHDENEEVEASDWGGIDCMSCHNLHDMGDWWSETGTIFANYNATKWAKPWGYRSGYDVAEDATSFCTYCHTHREDESQPGVTSGHSSIDLDIPAFGGNSPLTPHGSVQKQLFVNSPKHTGSFGMNSSLGFECTTCHMPEKEFVSPEDPNETGHYILHIWNVSASSWNISTDSQSDKNPLEILQESGTIAGKACSDCHGASLPAVENTAEQQEEMVEEKWEEVNSSLYSTYNTIKDSSETVKSLSWQKWYQAVFKFVLVENGKGVHNPPKAIEKLEEVETLLNEAEASLGEKSKDDLSEGWNLKSVREKPIYPAVEHSTNSISDSLEVLISYDPDYTNPYDGSHWKVYNPNDISHKTLDKVNKGKAYWVKVNKDTTWLVNYQ